MGMEISSRRLQEADSRMQRGRQGTERPVDDRDRDHFERAMRESPERGGRSGQGDTPSLRALRDGLFDSRMETGRQGAGRPVDDGGRELFEEDARGGLRQDTPSPQALLDSLFGSRMQSMKTDAAQVTPLPRDVDALVNALVDRILVSEPGKGSPEVRITLGQGPLSGAELSLARAQDGQLFIRIDCADPASFQTAVGAQDALRGALERNGENARVEIARSRADSGNEGDARQQSRSRQDYVPDVE